MANENSCVPTDLIPYVLVFLEQCGLEKTAKVLKKECKMTPYSFEGPGLLEFYKYYHSERQTPNVAKKKAKKKQLSDERQNGVEPKKSKPLLVAEPKKAAAGEIKKQKEKKKRQAQEWDAVQPASMDAPIHDSDSLSDGEGAMEVEGPKHKTMASYKSAGPRAHSTPAVKAGMKRSTTADAKPSSDSSSSDSQVIPVPKKMKLAEAVEKKDKPRQKAKPKSQLSAKKQVKETIKSETRDIARKTSYSVTPKVASASVMAATDSSSSIDSSDSETPPTIQQTQRPSAVKARPPAVVEQLPTDSSTGESSDGSSDDAQEVAKPQWKRTGKKVVGRRRGTDVAGSPKKKTEEESDTSSSITSTDSEHSDENIKNSKTSPSRAISTTKDKARISMISRDGNKSASKVSRVVSAVACHSTTSSSSDSKSSDSEDGAGTRIAGATPTEHTSLMPSKALKAKRTKTSVPFRRVEDVDVDRRLQNNSFEAKKGSKGSWGERANKDLKFTKGKSFRHEKTKKKRGTYRGGTIDTNVCSIRFDSDED